MRCGDCKYWMGGKNKDWGNCLNQSVYDMIETDTDNHPDFNRNYGCIYHKECTAYTNEEKILQHTTSAAQN